jgi:hypothetical protein
LGGLMREGGRQWVKNGGGGRLVFLPHQFGGRLFSSHPLKTLELNNSTGKDDERSSSSSSIGSEEGKKSRLNGGKFEAERRGRRGMRENCESQARWKHPPTCGKRQITAIGECFISHRGYVGGEAIWWGGGDIQKEAGSIRLS